MIFGNTADLKAQRAEMRRVFIEDYTKRLENLRSKFPVGLEFDYCGFRVTVLYVGAYPVKVAGETKFPAPVVRCHYGCTEGIKTIELPADVAEHLSRRWLP